MRPTAPSLGVVALVLCTSCTSADPPSADPREETNTSPSSRGACEAGDAAISEWYECVDPPGSPGSLGSLATTGTTGASAAMAHGGESPLAGLEAPWSDSDVRTVVERLLVEPERFLTEPEFRQRITEALPSALPAGVDVELRNRVLQALHADVGGLSFEQSERIETAWGAAPRSSAERRAAIPPASLRFADDYLPIDASIFSLPSTIVEPRDARSLLKTVRSFAPTRRLLVLADVPMRHALTDQIESLDLTVLDTYGRGYSPWPRDPFSVGVDPRQRLVLVERDAPQAQREEDLYMAREIVQNLPPTLDHEWGEVRWQPADLFFHNGHILTTEEALWLSIHALEIEILEHLGLDRVPVTSFATVDGVERYLAAARRVAAELGALFGRPVRFVHPLPESGTAREREVVMRTIGGGAGFDLDSVLTLVPTGDGRLAALVGDPSAVGELVAATPDEEWIGFRKLYGLQPPATGLPAALRAAQRRPAALRLDAFLDLVARHLEASGLEVRRAPLLLVPTAMLRGISGLRHPEFVVGWHNVVFEPHDGGLRAEGFRSGLPTADSAATELYASLGVTLRLLPSLPESVVLNGGYRCASNQVRRLPARATERAPAAVRDTTTADPAAGERVATRRSPARAR